MVVHMQLSTSHSSFMYYFHVTIWISPSYIFFFFNDTATTEIYTLSLHDALPIYLNEQIKAIHKELGRKDEKAEMEDLRKRIDEDRKSTRLNSSHLVISYAVFCLKKKKIHIA